MNSDKPRKKKQQHLVINSSSSCVISSSSSKSFHFISVRSIILCSSFLIFLLLLSSTHFSSIQPILTISSGGGGLSSLASYSIQDSAKRPSRGGVLKLRIEDRVLFPDHVLLFVSLNIESGLFNQGLFNCVYHGTNTNTSTRNENDVLRQPVLSVNEYNEYRMIVRCPVPPRGFSAAAGLQSVELKGESFVGVMDGRAVNSWDMLVYEAALAGDHTVVVFVKGLNLRPDRESDPARFSCRFWLGNRGMDKSFVFTTKAITSAQEVVRCPLPRSIRKNPDKARVFRVTVSMDKDSHGHSKASNDDDRVVLPSVAKLSSSNNFAIAKQRSKHELCVCTMVWNQASALREWIKYHAWLGVERWFIYDNNSDDEIGQVIETLENENYNVSRHAWPWIKTQEAGFSHCTLRAKDACNWVGFFDVDEFFYFPFPTRNQLTFPGQNSLRSLVAKFSYSTAIGELRTACHSFGPSGLSSPPLQGVTVGYTCRLQSPERHKSIVRPDALDSTLLNVVHHFRLKKGFRYLNVLQSKVVINHYKYQVWEVFRAKFFRRVATYVVDWQENQNEGSKYRAPGLGTEAIEPPNWRLRFCEVWDTGLRDFVLANLVDPATELLPWDRSLYIDSN